MVVVLNNNITEYKLKEVVKKIDDLGFITEIIKGATRTVLILVGNEPSFDPRKIQVIDGVADVVKISEPYKIASRQFKPEKTIVEVNGQKIGSDNLTLISGPCSIENEKQIHRLAEIVSRSGAKILRGGAFKPRSSPYSFQGLGEEGLKFMRAAADANKLAVCTEVLQNDQVDLVYRYTDIFQVGARNMQNFSLLKELAQTDKPVLLKRAVSATVEEWLMSAEYLLAGGNENVILCERGIRTFEKYTRFTFDLSSIPVLKEKTHLPVIADPSHASGIREHIPALAKAAVSAGADGLMLEIHHQPEIALSDGPQALLPEDYLELVLVINKIAELNGKSLI